MRCMGEILKRFKGLFIALAIIVFFIYSGISALTGADSKGVSVNVKTEKLTQLTTEQKLEDFNKIYSILEENYPYFEIQKRKYNYDWLSHKNEFEAMIKATSNNNEFYFALQKILANLQNGHTHIISPDLYDTFYESYKKTSASPWKNVIYDKNVRSHYDDWLDSLVYKGYYLPLHFTYVGGSYVLDGIANSNKAGAIDVAAGSLLLEVNSTKVDNYISSLSGTTYLSYDFKRSKPKLNSLIIQTENTSKVKLTLKTPEGKLNTIEVDPVSYSVPSSLKEKESGNIYTEILEKDKTAFVHINSFGAEYVEEDKTSLHNFWYEIKDYKNLIIDVRGNGGGSYEYWMENIIGQLNGNNLTMDTYIGFKDGAYAKPFLTSALKDESLQGVSRDTLANFSKAPPELKDFKHFIKVPLTTPPYRPVGYKGKIFILTDDEIYSSTEAFCIFAKATNWATLVGSTTGGDGVGYDPIYVALPNSGLIVRFPFGIGLNPDGTANEEFHTEPHYYVEQSLEDYLKYLSSYKDPKDTPKFRDFDTIYKKALNLLQ